MDEILKKLFESNILTEDTKKEIKGALEKALTEAVEKAKEETSVQVRADLTEQFLKERDTLIEALDEKVSDFLKEEMTELKGDIESFRDLEAEHAKKLVEAKKEMSINVKKDLKKLVEKLDTFVELRLANEIEELKEDLDAMRKNQFGKKLFEAFAAEYEAAHATKDDSKIKLANTNKKLEETEKKLTESVTHLNNIKRDLKMKEVLAPLKGTQKELMGAILKSVPTENLEEGYKKFIGRVLKEGSEQEKTKVLAEKKGEEVATTKTSVVNGDTKDNKLTVVTESSEEIAAKQRLKMLAGIV